MDYVDANLIDETSVTILAHVVHAGIIAFYESEENQRAFEQWKKRKQMEGEKNVTNESNFREIK